MPWPPPSLPPQTEDVLDLGEALADLARAARETRTTLWSALQVGLVLVWFDLTWRFLRQHNLLSWIVKLRLAFASWTRNRHERSNKARLKRLIPKVIPTKKRRRKSQMIKRKRNHILTFFCVQFYHSFFPLWKTKLEFTTKKSASQLKFLTRVVFFHNAMLLVIPVFMLFGDISAKD